jgi:hypothetical protein
MRFTKIISIICTITATLFLSNCGGDTGFDTVISDFESIFDDDFPEEKKMKPLPAVAKPITILPKPIAKKPIPKIIPVKKIPEDKAIEALQKEIAQKKIDACVQSLFLPQETVSNLYKIYIKSNKMCVKINDAKTKKHFVNILIQHYSSQDVRILNADKNFMLLYATAIKNADVADKVRLNKQILTFGCHLLNTNTCAIFKKSLF